MKIRAIAISAAAGTIAMFAWQAISHLVLPWHTMARSAAMGPLLAEQVAVDLVVVVAFCVLCGLLIDQSPIGVAKAFALAGLAISMFQSLSMTVWYGFTIPRAIVEIADQTITFFLTGLVIGFLMRRYGRDAGVAIPDGQGYRTSGGRTTAAR
jgi:hypothetical protein